jgi:hypothetical protein
MATFAHVAIDECPFVPNSGAWANFVSWVPIKILKLAGLRAGLLLLLSRTSAADPIHLFESGTPGPDGQTNGTPFGDFQFIGLRFFVPSTVTTETIGGRHLDSIRSGPCLTERHAAAAQRQDSRRPAPTFRLQSVPCPGTLGWS